MGVTRRCRHILFAVAGATLGVVAAGVPAASAAPVRAAGASVPVQPCLTVSAMAAPRASRDAPSSVTLPVPVTLPPGAQVYGAVNPYTSAPIFAIAPAGLSCVLGMAVDGSYGVSIGASGSAVSPVSYSYFPSGTSVGAGVACPYIPAMAALLGPVGQSPVCAPPGRELLVTQIATGKPRLWAVTVLDPPGVSAGTGRSSTGDETLNVMVASADGQTQTASCALPAGQWQVCTASLDYFAAESIAAQAGPTAVAAIQAGVDQMGSGQAGLPGRQAAGEVPGEGCHASADVTMEHEIAESAGQPIAVPDEALDLPRLFGQVSVSFVPGEVAVCDTGLTAMLNTPGGFDDGNMSLGAKIPEGGRRGPFVYSAGAGRWLSVPGAPAGQQFVTQFDPASAEASIGGNLSLAFNPATGAAGLSLDIAHVSISAVRQDITLIAPPGPVLQVGLGPTLQISAGVTRKAVEDAVENEESGGTGGRSAEADVADDISGDVVSGIDESASEFYGLDLSPQLNRQLARELADSLLSALETDPVLEAFTPADEDPVTSEVTPADSGAVDAETSAGGVADVGGSGILDGLLDFMLIP